MDDGDDLALFDRWCAGDQAAGTALFRRHYPAIYRFFANKVEAADAEELCQDTFAGLIAGRERFGRRTTVRSYLYAIARNRLLLYWRQRSRWGDALDIDQVSVASLSTSAGSRLARDQERERVLAALRQLPLDLQTLVELHYWEELDRQELADVFGVATATTRSRLHRARRSLRDYLATSGDDAVDSLVRAAGKSGPRGD